MKINKQTAKYNRRNLKYDMSIPPPKLKFHEKKVENKVSKLERRYSRNYYQYKTDAFQEKRQGNIKESGVIKKRNEKPIKYEKNRFSKENLLFYTSSALREIHFNNNSSYINKNKNNVSPNLSESELSNLRAKSEINKGETSNYPRKNKNGRKNYKFKEIKVVTNNEIIKTINENFSLLRNEMNNLFKNSQRETLKSLNSINNLLLKLLIGQNKLIELAKKK